MNFKSASRQQIKLRLAVTGPSGSGKTYSALSVASGMGGKIAVVDTENGTASLYSDNFRFDVLTINPPYTVERYLSAMKMAFDEKYDVLIIDSISHLWEGEGGLLDKKGALDMRGGNSFTNWQPITKEYEIFRSNILHPKCHLICTIRSKQEYVVEQSDKGKMIPRKIGLAPIQRPNLEYEFDLVLDMAMDHNAQVSKTRIKKYDGLVFKPTPSVGEDLLQWLNEGKTVPKEEPRRGWQENSKLATIHEMLATHCDGNLVSMNELIITLTNGKLKLLDEVLMLTDEKWIDALYNKVKKELGDKVNEHV